MLVMLLFVMTTSLAADGWYLLIPPRSEYNERADYLSGYTILDSKPLSQWVLRGGYDSASRCETAQLLLQMTAERAYTTSSEEYVKAIGAATDPLALGTQRFLVETDNANFRALMASRCVQQQ